MIAWRRNLDCETLHIYRRSGTIFQPAAKVIKSSFIKYVLYLVLSSNINYMIFIRPLDISLIVRQVVIAITLTPVRRKRHMQFLTSAPFFEGGIGAGGQLTPLTRPSRVPSHLQIKTPSQAGVAYFIGIEMHGRKKINRFNFEKSI